PRSLPLAGPGAAHCEIQALAGRVRITCIRKRDAETGGQINHGGRPVSVQVTCTAISVAVSEGIEGLPVTCLYIGSEGRRDNQATDDTDDLSYIHSEFSRLSGSACQASTTRMHRS